MTTRSTVRPARRKARASGERAAWAAAAVGGPFAAVSCYWGFGGTWLLGTVGGGLESAGRSREADVVVVLWVTVALKVAAVVLPLLAVRSPQRGRRRRLRRLAWVEAVVLTGYGAVLTAVGLLLQLGAVPTGADADRRALAWHAFLWDPWFLVWGLLVAGSLLASRAPAAAHVRPPLADRGRPVSRAVAP